MDIIHEDELPGSSWSGLRYFAPSLLILHFLGSIRIGQVAAIAVTAPLIRHWVEKRSILNVDKELLRRAPGFDRDHWANMADRAWGYRSLHLWDSRRDGAPVLGGAFRCFPTPQTVSNCGINLSGTNSFRVWNE